MALVEKNENKVDNSFKDDTSRRESDLNKLVNITREAVMHPIFSPLVVSIFLQEDYLHLMPYQAISQFLIVALQALHTFFKSSSLLRLEELTEI